MEAQYGIARIREILPHRHPFLLIDKVLDTNGEDHILALKNVTADEPFFQGHFPGNPVFPGVLQLETMAQAAGLMVLWQAPKDAEPPMLMSVMNAKFRRPVVPGDTMLVDVRLKRLHRSRASGIARFEGCIRVGEDVVSEATFLCMIPAAPKNSITPSNPD